MDKMVDIESAACQLCVRYSTGPVWAPGARPDPFLGQMA